MDILRKEIQQGTQVINMTDTGEEIEKFVQLVNHIITQYINDSQPLNHLIDLDSFWNVLMQTEMQLSQGLVEQIAKWYVDFCLYLYNKYENSNHQTL